MKISLNWIKEYVDLDGIPTAEIIEKLTLAGLEVEDAVDQNELYKGFIVGYVKEKNKHPNADRLSLCTVNNGTEDLQVICGAPNVEAGQKVIFAPIGTVIPKENFKLKKAKIRGVESNGMICSEAELGLSDNHEGIMVLDEKLKEGTPLTEALNLNDTLLEIAITPNRPDALSHFGVARDMAAIFNRELKIPEITSANKSGTKAEELASIEILDAKNCPRYTAKVVTGVTIKESPEWLKNKLTKIGLRPINNVVDVTNFILHETGQPLHGFDLDNLAGKKIIVQSTDKESKFVTLDSKERKLPAGTLMICDGEKPVAIAGVMGGENSEVTENTKDILIESAYFTASGVRRTSKLLGLSTDASYRFERGGNPGIVIYAAERAAQLIAEVADGKVAEGIIDVYPNEIPKKEIRLRYSRVDKILGYEIEPEKIKRILENLDITIISETEKEINVKAPLARPDLEREIDLIEEIARINGYDKIPTVPKISITLDEKFDESSFTEKLRDAAVSLGFYEMINNPLQSEKTASVIGEKIGMKNPQSLDMAFLRTSLVPGALETVHRNINVGEKDLSLFESGNVFNRKKEGELKELSELEESQRILFVITGYVSHKEWNTAEEPVDFYNLKGVINSYLSKIFLDNVLNDSYYHSVDPIYDYYFVKSYSKKVVGKGGAVKKSVLKQFDIDQDVFCFEFDVDALKNIEVPKKQYSELLRYPKAVRDFAFVFDKQVEYKDVVEFIHKEGSQLLKSVDIFDLFESESLGENKKSMAFTLEYYDESRTLKEEEVEEEFNRLISLITKKFNAVLRG